jgi:lambda family phage minor tail protein L
MLLYNNLLLGIPVSVLTIANVTQSTATANIIVSFTNVLIVTNLSIAETTTNISLTQANILNIDGITINQTSDNISLVQQNILSVDNLLENINLPNLFLSQQNTIIINSVINIEAIANISLIQQNLLQINNLLTNSVINNIIFSQANILVIANLLQTITLSNAFVSVNLPIANLLTVIITNNINLIQQNTLQLADITIYSVLDNIALTSPLFSTLNQLVLRSELPAYVELFIIDCTSIQDINTIYYLTPNLNTDGVTKVNFGGQIYQPFPIQLTGLSHTSDGAYPRPRIDLANVNKVFGTLAFIYGDLVGCSVTYIRTFAMYLNSNFHLSAPPLKYYIAKKLNHDTMGMSFELRSPLDKERAVLPARQMLKRDFPGLGINKVTR